MFTVHNIGHIGRKDLVAAVHPADDKGQRRQGIDQRLAHMTATKQCQRCARRHQKIAQPGQVSCTDGLKTQCQRTAAALPQAGAQHLMQSGLGGLACQQQPGMGQGLKLQMAATNRALLSLRKHQHAGARSSGNGALGRQYRDHHRVFSA
jgi:hypothetical protein